MANPVHLDVLTKSLKQHKAEVRIFDPLHLALPSDDDAKGLRAESVFDVGPLLLKVSRACLDVGTTPFLFHHSKKNPADPYQPLELQDLAYSG